MSNVQTYCGVCIRVGFKGVSSAWSLYFGGLFRWSLCSCGCVLYACMETQFRRPTISKKIRAVRPKLGKEATLLSLSCPIFFSETFKNFKWNKETFAQLMMLIEIAED